MRKKYIFTFPPGILGLFVFNRLVKGFDFWFNVLRAKIEPNVGGKLILEFYGDEDKIEKGIEEAKNNGVLVSSLDDDLVWAKDLCEDCGACISACPYQAISIDRDDFELHIDFNKCVACGKCAKVCPVNALSLNY
ncbi:MAG TPA: 4Fe-4S binding protein [Candidatus Methanofastidiosa archaeon]|nr:4Fe-4S binding protein [Candidatus Methanofastidiosa archaeon]HPR41114.1 4Fe-4S binding protein [Candidatus Methanofastidiosa archaeon]